jgi:hypothetical protein
MIHRPDKTNTAPTRRRTKTIFHLLSGLLADQLWDRQRCLENMSGTYCIWSCWRVVVLYRDLLAGCAEPRDSQASLFVVVSESPVKKAKRSRMGRSDDQTCDALSSEFQKLNKNDGTVILIRWSLLSRTSIVDLTSGHSNTAMLSRLILD